MDKSYLKDKAKLGKLREQSPEDRALSNVGKIRTNMNNIEDNRFENISFEWKLLCKEKRG